MILREKKLEHQQIQSRLENLKQIQKSGKQNTYSKNHRFNIAFDLLAAVILALFIGLFLDDLFNSKPLFIIIFSILGFLSVFRSIFLSLDSRKNYKLKK